MGFFLFGSILSAVSTSMIMLIVFRELFSFYSIRWNNESNTPCRSCIRNWRWRHLDVCHDCCVWRCLSWKAWHLSGCNWSSRCDVKCHWPSYRRCFHWEGFLEMVLREFPSPLVSEDDLDLIHDQYINIPLTAISILVVIFVLPLKRVKGNHKLRFKQIDYLGCATMFIASILILLPISWWVALVQALWIFNCVCLLYIQGRNSIRLELCRRHCSSSHWDRFYRSFHTGGTEICSSATYTQYATIQRGLLHRLTICVLVHIFKNSTVSGAMAGSFFQGFMFYTNLYYVSFKLLIFLINLKG